MIIVSRTRVFSLFSFIDVLARLSPALDVQEPEFIERLSKGGVALHTISAIRSCLTFPTSIMVIAF